MNVRLTIDGSTLHGIFAAASSTLQEKLTAEMSEILRAQGFVVEIPKKWETVAEICARLGIHPGTFSRKISLPNCPKPHDVIRDGRGITHIRSHPTLDRFLSRHPQPNQHNTKSSS